MAQVSLNNLVKDYRDGKGKTFRAVKEINLEIRDREFMVLVGPSGCGKSTTLRMIAGLEEISGGNIDIGEKTVNHVLPKDRDIAMVFQNYALYPHKTVYENMAFGLRLMKRSKDEIKTEVESAAKILGIEQLLQRRPKELSGGQRQRVAVGRAIVRRPKVFLFDEPLSNLDAKMRVSMRTEISKLHSLLSATMIYVTHDQTEAMTMADRICVMKDGNIMQVDDPLTIYNKPENMFVAGFIGSPPINFIKGTLLPDGERLKFKETHSTGNGFEIGLTNELSSKGHSHINKEVVLGVRPEDVTRGESEDLGHPTITAHIEVSEPMGSETYLYLNTGEHSLIGRVGSDSRHRVNEDTQVSLNLANAHLFDPETESVLK